jgi:hypothetical protein
MTPPTAAPARAHPGQAGQKKTPKATGGAKPAVRPVSRRARAGRSAVRPHRRVSGPVRPAAAARAVSLPRAVAAPLPLPKVGPLGDRALHGLRSLRDSRLVDRLVSGQGWIALLGVLLIGLVALNVSLLKLNAQNGRSAEHARDLRIQNAKLRGTVSRLGSSDRLQAKAREMGLVMPAPSMVTYLTVRPRVDGRQAARNVRLDLPPAASEQRVSASPEADRELATPTPSEPIADSPPAPAPGTVAPGTAPTAPTTGAPTGATGPTGPTGAAPAVPAPGDPGTGEAPADPGAGAGG